MTEKLLIKYSEIGVKGNNRYIFEDMLVRNIKSALKEMTHPCEVRKADGRIYISYEEEDYECDCDSKFGLYDYSLLINLKSWNKIFFSLIVNTCDLKYDEEEDKDNFYYIDKTNLISPHPLNFELK